jgi:RNA polymerase sigma-70 factor (ECF subfamily)
LQFFRGGISILNSTNILQVSNYEPDINELIEMYSDMVYKIALVQMKNRDNADDIFQEVFLRLVKNLSKIDSQEHAKAWLIRVTLNCCKTYFLSSWYKKTTTLEDNLFSENIFEEQESDLLEAVMKLSPPYRNVIHLFYYEGYSIAEISTILKKKENTIKSHLFRARNLLKEQLGKEELFEEE